MFSRAVRITFFANLLALAAISAALASPGSLDYTYGTNGLVKTDFSLVDEGAAVAVYQSGTYAGKTVVAGTVAPEDNSWNKFAVARYNIDGSLDTGFGTGGMATIALTAGGYDRASAVLIQNDDKIVVVGQANNGLQIGLVRYNADGTLDTGFGIGGVVRQVIGTSYGSWSGAVLQGDGNIAVVGQVQDSTYPDYIHSDLVRFNSAGAYINTWQTDFASTWSYEISPGVYQDFVSYEGFSAVAAQSDGKLVAVGYANTKTGQAATMTAARFLANGGLDASFGSGGKTTVSFSTDNSDYASGVAIQGDGSIVIGGRAGVSGGGNVFALARLTSSGTLDTAFNGTGKATIDAGGANEANALAIQSDGKILLAGYTTNFGVARFNTNGTSDTSFGTNGVATVDFGSDDRAYGMALQADGKIILAGWSGDDGTGRDFALARLNSQSTAMLYGSSTVSQNTDVISPGSTGDIIRIAVTTGGDLSPLSATSFTCSTSGTTSTADISGARLYYTGTSPAFSTATPFGSAVSSPSGSFTITGSQTLAEGTNYFWLAYTVSPSATTGNVLDADCTSITVGGTARTPTVTAPAGSRQIFNVLAIYDVGSHVPENNGGTNYLTTNFVAPGMTASNLTAGTGLTEDQYYTDTGLYVYTNWTTSSTPDPNQYFQVTITPYAAKQVTYDKLTFTVVADNYDGTPPYYGPTTIDLRYSTDNFVSSNVLLKTLTWTPSDVFEQKTFTDVDISAVGTRSGPVTFRWYGYKQNASADSTSSMGFANWVSGTSGASGTGSNIIFKGTVTSTVTPPAITKGFGAAAIPLNGTTTLTFNITNPDASVTQTGLAFSDNLPAGLVVASTPNLSNSCGGTATAVGGSSGVSLSGANLAPGASCTVSVDMQGTSAGVKNNSVQVTSANGGTGNTSNASIKVISPPTITKVFGAASVPLNGATSLTFTINNPNSTTALNGIGFTDTLPAGLIISTPNGLTGSCGSGTITATQGTGVLSLTGGTLGASGSCTFSVNVTGTAAGTQNNTTGSVTSTEGGTGGTASASIVVGAPPSIAMAFNPASIAPGETSQLTFTITNPAANTAAATGVAFTDTLPAGMVVATPNGLANSCGGTATATAGSGSISLTAGNIGINSSCTVTVNVTAQGGQYTNITGTVSSTNGGTGNTATANLSATQAPAITSANNSTFTIGTAGTFTVTATGYPAPTITESGTLPQGVTFSAGVLSGTPAIGTAKTYNITFTAHNSSGADATQNFTLTVAFDPGNPVLTLSTLSDGAVTTNPVLNISGAVTGPNGIQSLTINGVQITFSSDGGFSFPVQLDLGANTITIVATDNAGHQSTSTRHITLTPTAPAITFISPADGSTTNQNSTTVTGTTTAGSTVDASVNGGAAQAAAVNGTDFSITVSLASGLNTIEATATNAGVSSSAKLTIISNTTGPDLAITSPAVDVVTADQALTITGTVTTSTPSVTVSIDVDGQTYTPAVAGGAFQQQFTLSAEKNYSIVATATDANSNAAAARRNVIYSLTASGDINCDGKIDVADALMAMKASVNLVTPTADQLKRGDVAPLVNAVPEPDGKIDIEDAILILRKAVGLGW